MQAVIVNGRPGDKNRSGFERARLAAAPPAAPKENGALAPDVACYISDLMPTAAHIDITWAMGFDLYPLQPSRARSSTSAEGDSRKMADGVHA